MGPNQISGGPEFGWIRFEITAKAEQSVGDHDLITLQIPRTAIR